MTDPNMAGQPSEEEMRAYVEQLREADSAQIFVQAYQILGTGAEVKLGRGDARPLIDAMESLIAVADGAITDELVDQMREGVRQLQMAQVQAEQEAGAEEVEEQGQAGTQPDGAAAQSPPQAPSAPPAQEKKSDRLWIPGQ